MGGWCKMEMNNNFFDKYGYLKVEKLYDPQELFDEVPKERGQINYYGSVDRYDHIPKESQVNGSLARYSHPKYKYIHSQIRLKLEKILGKKLYNTYYYDRFYFPGQELTKHTDRDACEISVTVHISSSLKECWPIWIETPDKEESSVCLSAGDGMIYKGCERPHWREPMKGKKKTWWRKKEDYYHQIFFHYVLADGERVHCAFDLSK